MKKIDYVVRPYIHKSGRVLVRVRWNNSKIGTAFTTGSSADPEKWNKDANRAKINTTHNVKGVTYSSKDINARIENVLDVVSQVFYKFEVAEKMPMISSFHVRWNLIGELKLTFAIKKLSRNTMIMQRKRMSGFWK